MLTIASSAELHLPSKIERYTRHNSLIRTEFFDAIAEECRNDEEKFLDAIDAVLEFAKKARAKELEQILQAGGSSWRVSDDKTSLQWRVDETAQRAVDEALRPGDLASDELRSAWSAAYGRSPNASDAWDHAIKAVEAILVPIVLPNVRAGRLGQAIGQLRSQGNQFQLTRLLGDDSDDVGVLVVMLDKLYPNPDRHANDRRREPNLAEAQAVVHLAVTLVQWMRDGMITGV